MKKIFTILMLSSLILTFGSISAVPVKAQGFGITWNASFQVLNLSDTQEATINIFYYNQDGTLATMESGFSNPVADTVAAGRSNTYYPVHAASGFNGSVAIQSSVDVAVISNLVAGTPQAGLGSYVGFKQGDSKLSFPLVMKGNSSNTTTFNVQNTGGTEAGITIEFTPEAGSTYANISDVTDTIQPGAAQTYDLSQMTEFSAISKWVGSATVTVDDTVNDSIAGVATTVNTKNADAYQLLTYNGFTSGSSTVVLPLIQENNNGNRTSINCQNIDPATTTDVTVTYTPGTGYGAKSSENAADVPSNGMAVFLQDYQGATSWVGSATVTANPAVPLVCVVNQQKPLIGTASAYEGFDPGAATDKVVVPLVQSRNGSASSGWVYTSINIATADGNSHPVSCDFSPAPGFNDPTDASGSGASVVFLQNDVYGNGDKFIGGAICTTGDGSDIFAIVNQTRQGTPQTPRDVLSTYDAFNQ
jgi:hypothetical protein